MSKPRKYRCTVCSHVYDPAEGDPAAGIAPGTPFEAIPEDCIAVSESGLRSAEDLARLRAASFDAFLIGERLMQEADAAAALRRLLAA